MKSGWGIGKRTKFHHFKEGKSLCGKYSVLSDNKLVEKIETMFPGTSILSIAGQTCPKCLAIFSGVKEINNRTGEKLPEKTRRKRENAKDFRKSFGIDLRVK